MSANKRDFGDPNSIRPIRGSAGWVKDLARARRAGPTLGDGFGKKGLGASTLAVHAGSHDDPGTGMVGTPIYQGSTFLLGEGQYASIEEGHAREKLIYSRYGNPSQWAVQEKMAALEGAESALVFSSGMGAIAATVLGLMDRGGHVVASNEIYGGTYSFFNNELPSFGMSVTLVDPRDFEAIEAAIRPETQILYFEALTNPLLKLADIPRLVALARRKKLRLVIDATFITPLGCRPIEMGADVVLHSASKYLNGHSDLIAGVAAGSRKLMDMIWPKLLSFGACLDPHACFLLERGLKTLAIRMKAHQFSAINLARWMESHPKIKRVYYPLLESHPDHWLAKDILKIGPGMITFEVEGGDAAALELMQHLRLPKEATSLGGVETLISLPFNTSQAGFTAKMRERMGINPGCVRLSVGIEDPDDLVHDFAQALELLDHSKEPIIQDRIKEHA